MNSVYTPIKLLFILLLQVLVCNHIYFLGFINPYIYVAFVFLVPLNRNLYLFLIAAFFYGLAIDFFSDTGGIHAFSLVFVCYIRLFVLNFFFRKLDIDFLLFRLHDQPFLKVIGYVAILTFIHHFLLFAIANFSFINLVDVFLNALYSSAFTIILYFLGSYIVYKKSYTHT